MSASSAGFPVRFARGTVGRGASSRMKTVCGASMASNSRITIPCPERVFMVFTGFAIHQISGLSLVPPAPRLGARASSPRPATAGRRRHNRVGRAADSSAAPRAPSRPVRRAAPCAPTLVPEIARTRSARPSSHIAFQTPAWKAPFAPPPERTRPIAPLFIFFVWWGG